MPQVRRPVPTAYAQPQVTDPYYGDYSALAQQLQQSRTKPIYSVGQGIAEAGGDIVSAYFEKKARDEAEKKMGKDNAALAQALSFAGNPDMRQEGGVALNPQDFQAPIFDQSKVSALPQMTAQQRAVAALAGVPDRLKMSAYGPLMDTAKGAQPPKFTGTLKPGEHGFIEGTDVASAPFEPKIMTPEEEAQKIRIAQASRPPKEAEPTVEIADPTSPTGRRIVTRSEAIGKAGPAQTSQSPSQVENTLRDEFNNLVGPAKIMVTQYSNAKKAAAAQTAAGDMSLIYSLMKILDPGSTVREGEYAQGENLTGAYGKFWQMMNKAKDGEKLLPETRADILGRINDIYQTQKPFVKNTVDRYTEIAKRNSVNPDNVVGDIFKGVEDDAPDYSKMTDEQLKAEYAKRKL
jgi:hypothetical protein